MKTWFKSLDRILRGEATRLPNLSKGMIDLPLGGLTFLLILLAIIYGAFMGVTAVITRWGTPERYMGFQQLAASAAKVPLLFSLTFLVTFPSLYVFNALIGSRLSMNAMLRLLVAAMAVMLAVLASFGPIVGFFAASTTSYPFMKLLNVVIFGLAGLLGLTFLLRTLHRLTLADMMLPPIEPESAAHTGEGDQAQENAPAPGDAARAQSLGAIDRLSTPTSDSVRTIFRIWVFIFGLVGAQMAWVLRPFIGDPDKPFSFFRPRDSNFFEAVLKALSDLLGMTHGGGRW